MSDQREGDQQSQPSCGKDAYDLFRWPIKEIERRFQEYQTKKKSETAQDRAARRTANATNWIAAFTAISVGVNVAVFYVLKSQLNEMKSSGEDAKKLIDANVKLADSAQRSADIAKSTLIIAQGASVSVDHFMSTNVVKDNVQVGVSFNIIWKNSGMTRANNFINFIQAKIFEHGIPENFDFKKLPEGIPIPGFINGGSVISSSNIIVNKSDLELVKSSERALYILGGAIYNDMFNGTPKHHAYICARVKIVRELFGPADPFAYEAYKYEAD